MDKYTKIILAVIAVSMFKLAFLGFNPIINSANKIAICDKEGEWCSEIVYLTKDKQKALNVNNSGN